MQQKSKYGFSVGETVIFNDKTDSIIGFIDDSSEDCKKGYNLILKEGGNQSLASVKRLLIKWNSLYGQEGDILLPQIIYICGKKVHNRIECPKCGEEMYDNDPSTIYETSPAQTTIECNCGFKDMRYISDEKDWLELTLYLQSQFPLIREIWELIEIVSDYQTVDEIIETISKSNQRAQKFIGRYKEPVKVTRLEVISSNGRQYVNMNVENLELSYQDDGRTLKILIK